MCILPNILNQKLKLPLHVSFNHWDEFRVWIGSSLLANISPAGCIVKTTPITCLESKYYYSIGYSYIIMRRLYFQSALTYSV